MKVIKKGREQKGWTQKYKCTGHGNGNGGCGANLLVSEGDIYMTARYFYDGSTDYYYTFCCVDCGVETDVDGDGAKYTCRIPGHVKTKAKKNKKPRK